MHALGIVSQYTVRRRYVCDKDSEKYDQLINSYLENEVGELVVPLDVRSNVLVGADSRMRV